MRRTKVFYAIIFFMSFLMLVACDAQPSTESSEPVPEQKNPPIVYDEKGQDRVIVYYVKDGFLVPITFKIEPTKRPVKAALDLLLSGITPEGFENEIYGVRLINFNIDQDTIVVDVSSEFLKGTTKVKKEQLLLTLTEFDGIKRVKIMVEGRAFNGPSERPNMVNKVTLPQKDGHPSTEQNPTKIMKDNAAEVYLTVYYADKSKRFIVPVTFNSSKVLLAKDSRGEVIPPAPEDLAKAAVEHLIEGPGDIANLAGIFPKEVRLKDFYVKDGVAYVDVSKDLILNFANAEYEKIAVESVVQTLTSIDDIDKVQFLIDGNRMGSIAGHTNISIPIPRMKWYNEIE